MTPSFFSLIQYRQIWSRLIANFFIWLIPGLFVLIMFLAILLISFEAADGSLLEIPMNESRGLPKGLMSFLSIGLMATSVLVFNCIWYFSPVSLEGGIQIIFFGIVVLVLGIWLFNKEVKRIYSTIKK